MHKNKPKTGLIFDLDGTLIDSKTKLQNDIIGTMARLGHTVTQEETQGNWYKMAEKYGIDKEVFDAELDKRKTWEQSLKDGEILIFPETISCLEQLRKKKIILALLSRSTPECTKQKLDYFNLDRYFEQVETVDPERPSKIEGVEKICQKFIPLGISHIYCVGDRTEDIKITKYIQDNYKINSSGILVNRTASQISVLPEAKVAKSLNQVLKIVGL